MKYAVMRSIFRACLKLPLAANQGEFK